MDGSTSSNTQLKWILLASGPKAILGPAGAALGPAFTRTQWHEVLLDPLEFGPTPSRTQANCYNECPVEEKEKEKLLNEQLLSKTSTWYQISS
jgi:hypothetical protein